MLMLHGAGGALRVALAAGLLLGCTGKTPSGPSATSSAGTPSSITEAVPDGWKTCTNRVEDFTVAYPADWHTTDVVFGNRDRSRACRYFDHAPFDPELGAEPNDEGLTFPIQISTQGTDADTIAASRAVELVTREEITVAGLSATRLETILTRRMLGAPVGAYYRYVIDTPDDGSFTVITAQHLDPSRYEQNKRIVDRIVTTLTIA